GAVAARDARRHPTLWRMRWTTAAVARSGAMLSTRTCRAAKTIAVRPIASEWLAAALMARTEPVLTAAGLTDREFGNGPGGRRLALARQGRANQRPMHRSFFVLASFVL